LRYAAIGSSLVFAPHALQKIFAEGKEKAKEKQKPITEMTQEEIVKKYLAEFDAEFESIHEDDKTYALLSEFMHQHYRGREGSKVVQSMREGINLVDETFNRADWQYRDVHRNDAIRVARGWHRSALLRFANPIPRSLYREMPRNAFMRYWVSEHLPRLENLYPLRVPPGKMTFPLFWDYISKNINLPFGNLPKDDEERLQKEVVTIPLKDNKLSTVLMREANTHKLNIDVKMDGQNKYIPGTIGVVPPNPEMRNVQYKEYGDRLVKIYECRDLNTGEWVQKSEEWPLSQWTIGRSR
jgi:uncharacterized protein YrzB (UPF0473 family)